MPLKTANNPPYITHNSLFVILFIVLALIPFGLFFLNPNQLLLEHHAFRQTQTAITAYWLIRGSPSIQYLTPILGYPWTIPFEFPLFQELTALLCSATGMPLDLSGRALSLFFFFTTFVPIFACLRPYGRAPLLIALALYVTGPISLFFSRLFLIETFATSLALSSLCCYILFLRRQNWAYLCALVILGSLAGLQKVTTFLPVAIVCGMDSVRTQIYPLLRGQWRNIQYKAPLAIISSMVLPLIWAAYSDEIKSHGALSVLLTSKALWSWNFGTLAQRLQPMQWFRLIVLRLVLVGGLLVPVLLMPLAVRRNQLMFNREAGLCLFAGLLGPIIFFNLHSVHDYYQVGSLAFLDCAVAISLAPFLTTTTSSPNGYAIPIAAAIIIANLSLFCVRYGPLLFHIPKEDATAYEVGRYLEQHQTLNDVSVILGQGYNSTIPYYSQRYALMIPESPFVPAALRARILRNPNAYIGARRIGSIVFCSSPGLSSPPAATEETEIFRQLDAGSMKTIDNCEIKIRDDRQDPQR
jgi:hypothetical protein